MDAADVPGPHCWRCWVANEQTNGGRRVGDSPKSPSWSLEESFFFLPPWENINCCFINSCHFLTYKDSQSFPFVYFDDLWNKLQPRVKKNFHVHFSERGLCCHNVLSAADSEAGCSPGPGLQALFPKPLTGQLQVMWVTGLKAKQFSAGQTLL